MVVLFPGLNKIRPGVGPWVEYGGLRFVNFREEIFLNFNLRAPPSFMEMNRQTAKFNVQKL